MKRLMDTLNLGLVALLLIGLYLVWSYDEFSLWPTLVVILVVNQFKELLMAWILKRALNKGKIELYDIRLTPGNQKWWLGISLILLTFLGVFTDLKWELLAMILLVTGPLINTILPILNWSIMIQDGRVHTDSPWRKSISTKDIVDAYSTGSDKVVYITLQKQLELEFETVEESERFLIRLRQLIETPKSSETIFK